MPTGEYRRSLKHPEAEEVFDLWFYRPVAYLFVRAVYRTPLTPNQVTILSLVAALAAAYCFASGTMSLLAAGAAWYAIANILDCADGQLARLQNSGTPNGRLWDGVADYIGSTAIFIGIGVGFSLLGMNLWFTVVAAGLSSALHAMIFDHAQGAFIAGARGEKTTQAPASPGTPAAGGGPAAVSPGAEANLLHRMYGTYTRTQARMMALITPGSGPPDAGVSTGGATTSGISDRSRATALIRLWSFLGPTTNRTALIAFALIGRIDIFLWAVIIPGNLWMIAMIYLQKRSMAAGGPPAPGSEPIGE